MNNNQQSNTPIIQKPSNNVLIIILAVVITALLVGGAMYYYQTTVFNKEKSELEDRIEELENQVVQALSQDEDTQSEDQVAQVSSENGDIQPEGQVGQENMYRDEEYGFEFEQYTDSKKYITVKKEGNKTIVCGDQSVEIFRKNPEQTLKEVIEEQFLKDYSPDKCWAEISLSDRDDYYYGEILYPFQPSGSPDPWWENRKFCPEYSRTNGGTYFMMDPAHPDRFAYFEIGQAACMHSWHTTFKFID